MAACLEGDSARLFWERRCSRINLYLVMLWDSKSNQLNGHTFRHVGAFSNGSIEFSHFDNAKLHRQVTSLTRLRRAQRVALLEHRSKAWSVTLQGRCTHRVYKCGASRHDSTGKLQSTSVRGCGCNGLYGTCLCWRSLLRLVLQLLRIANPPAFNGTCSCLGRHLLAVAYIQIVFEESLVSLESKRNLYFPASLYGS